MKIIPKATSKKVPWLKLYLDDLVNIVGLVSSSCETVSVSGHGYEFEFLNDADEYKCISEEQFETFKIQGKNPNIEIKSYYEEDSGGFEILIEEDDAESMGLMLKVSSYLEKRKRSNVEKLKQFNLLIFAAYFFSILYFLGDTVLDEYSLYVVFGVSALHWLICRMLRMDRYLILEKTKSTDVKSFFNRKKDEINLLFIGAFLGAVFGVFSTLAVSFFVK